MNCSAARRHIAAGMRPGSRTSEQTLLGFHLISCAECQAVFAAQTALDDSLLQLLLAQTPPVSASVAVPTRPRVRRWPVVALVCALLIIGGLAGRAWWTSTHASSQPTASAPATAPDQPTSTLPVAGGVEPPPAAVAAVTVTPLGRPPPTATPEPSVTATPEPTATPTVTPEPTATPLALKPLNILLLGLDRRPGEGGTSRADSLIIVHIDPLSSTVALLSLPRDLWVPLTDYGYSVKINAAYTAGEENGGAERGALVAQQTVSELIGQPIDYTVVTTFEGLINTVDAVGGVDIDVQKEIYDASYPTFDYGYMVAHFLPGQQRMDGSTALIYSRTRHADNDFERGRRQQQVAIALLSSMRQQAESGDFLATSTLINTLYNDLEYTNLELPTALQLALAMQAFDPATIRRDSVDLRYGYETSTYDGAYIIAPDLPAIQQLAADLFRK